MTVDIASLVSDNLDIWTTVVDRKSGTGRGGGKRISFYGIDRLRSLIVDLAVRGKLTSQQPDEEPATAALAKFAKARRRKIELGQARKPKALLPFPANLPNLPEGWVWTQLGTIAEISPSNNADDQVDASFVPMALVSTRIDGVHETETRKWSEIKKGFTHFSEGDIGLAKITPCFENGKAAIFENLTNGIGAGTTELHVARPWSDDINRRYLLLTMKTASYLHQGETGMTGTAGQKRVPRSYFESSPLPLPPLVEQQRIVAKVDELMTLCDALETESASAIAAHQTLVEALLTTLTTSTDAADLATNWDRLKAHFDTLFITEASVDALKQSILDLAVHGKLATQDKNDEGAVKLIKRIEVERTKLIGTKKASKIPTKADSTVMLARGWEWTPVGCLGFTKTGGTPKSAEPENFVGSIPFIGPGQISPTGKILAAEKFISETGLTQSTEALPGDILMVCIGGSIGKAAIACTRMAYNQQINSLRPVLAEGRYINMYLRCSRFQADVLDLATGSATPIINRSRWETIPVALPPLSEQHRIVAKVDVLHSMCDQLISNLADASQTQRHLADAITQQAAV